MKKLLLLFTLFAGIGCMAGARELRFYMDDLRITDGSTVTYDKVEVTEIPIPGMGTLKKVKMEPPLYIWSDMMSNTVGVTAKCTSGQKVQMCCGGECARGLTVTKENVRVNKGDAGRVSLQFEYLEDFAPGTEQKIPTVTVEFSAFDSKSSSAKASFTLVMGENASVESVENSEEISVTSRELRHDISGTARVSVFNLLGNKVLDSVISGSGSVSLTGLVDGVYVYTVKGDTIHKTGKVYISR